MNTSTTNAKYFFLELGIIAALYISAFSFITFAFYIINYLFPDRLAYGFDAYSSGLRFAISTLIIVFPIFVILARMMWKSLLTDIEGRNLVVRKWLSYLTLFIAGAAITGDLVALVNTFLDGEISSRFIAKVIVVLVVALAVFLYTLKDLKGVFYERPALFKKTMTTISVIIILCIIGGFMIIGAPASQRDLRDDMTRSNNLQMLQSDIVSYYQRTGKLPASTNDLIDPLYPYSEHHMDPATGAPYEYRIIASSTPTFELCASFALPSRTDEYKGRGGYPSGYSARYSYVDYHPTYGDAFEHVEGLNCFTRIIDPTRYPIQKPPVPGEPTPRTI